MLLDNNCQGVVGVIPGPHFGLSRLPAIFQLVFAVGTVCSLPVPQRTGSRPPGNSGSTPPRGQLHQPTLHRPGWQYVYTHQHRPSRPGNHTAMSAHRQLPPRHGHSQLLSVGLSLTIWKGPSKPVAQRPSHCHCRPQHCILRSAAPAAALASSGYCCCCSCSISAATDSGSRIFCAHKTSLFLLSPG